MDSRPSNLMVGLPIEILLRITGMLTTIDLGAMRLTCKHIERSLFNSFGYEFFRKKRFMLSDESLQALVDISHHEAFSPLLKHVIIGLDQFDVNKTTSVSPDAAIFYRTATGRQLSLIRTGRAVQMLTEAFRHLKNLETVDIRDFEGKGRTRDGPNSRWRSYGASEIQNRTGHDLSTAVGINNDYATTVFTITMAALAEASCQLKNLEVLLRARSRGLTDFAFDMTCRKGVSMTDVISRLDRLHLDVNLSFVPIALQDGGVDSPTPGLLLHRFLAEAHALTWLRLNFQNAWIEVCDTFIARLRSPLSAVQLPSLTRLDLGYAAFCSSKLIEVWARFPRLTAVSFWKVTLLDATYQSIQSNLWSDNLRQLAKMPSLKSLSIGFASQLKQGSLRGSITFDGKPTFDYSGHAIGQALEKLAIGFELLRPPRQVFGGVVYAADDEDDEDDENGEEEEVEEEEDGDDDNEDSEGSDDEDEEAGHSGSESSGSWYGDN